MRKKVRNKRTGQVLEFDWNSDEPVSDEYIDSISQQQKSPEDEIVEAFGSKDDESKKPSFFDRFDPRTWKSAGDIPFLGGGAATLGEIGQVLDTAQKPVRTASEYYSGIPAALDPQHEPTPIGEQAKEIFGLTENYQPQERIGINLGPAGMVTPQIGNLDPIEEGLTKFAVGTGAEALTDPTNLVPLFKGAGVLGHGAGALDAALVGAGISQAPAALEQGYQGVKEGNLEKVLQGAFGGIVMPTLGAHGLRDPHALVNPHQYEHPIEPSRLSAELGDIDNLSATGLLSERTWVQPEEQVIDRPQYGELSDIDELIEAKYPERNNLEQPQTEDIGDVEPVRQTNLLQEEAPQPQELILPPEGFESPNIREIKNNLLADQDIEQRNRVRQRNVIEPPEVEPNVPRETLDLGEQRLDNRIANDLEDHPLSPYKREPQELIAPAEDIPNLEPVRKTNIVQTPEEAALKPSNEPIEIQEVTGTQSKQRRHEKLQSILNKTGQKDLSGLKKSAAEIALSESPRISKSESIKGIRTEPTAHTQKVLRNKSIATNNSDNNGFKVSKPLFDTLTSRKYTEDLDNTILEHAQTLRDSLAETMGEHIKDTDILGPEYGSNRIGAHINHEGSKWITYNIFEAFREADEAGSKNYSDTVDKVSGRMAMTLTHEFIHSNVLEHNENFAAFLTRDGGYNLDKMVAAKNSIKEVLTKHEKDIVNDYLDYRNERKQSRGKDKVATGLPESNTRRSASESPRGNGKERVSDIITGETKFESTREQLRRERESRERKPPGPRASIEEAKAPTESAKLPGRFKRAVLPVKDILKSLKDKPEIAERVQKYERDWDANAGEAIADRRDATQGLSKDQISSLVETLDSGKTPLDKQVEKAAQSIRQLLDRVADKAQTQDVLINRREDYFPHRFSDDSWDFDTQAKGFDVKNKAESNLERARSGKEGYRKDIGVLDEYLSDAYRRIAESEHLGKSLQKVFSQAEFSGKKGTELTKYVEDSIKRETGREKHGPVAKTAMKARHLQALSDLALTAIYQPGQAAHTAAYGGMRRSLRAIGRIFQDSGKELNDAIRSGSLASTIRGELAAASGAEGKTAKFTHGFMYGAPTVDKWMRVHSNVVGKLLVEDALAGKKGAISDLKRLGFTRESNPREVGKALADKTQFRTGVLDMPNWASTPGGKLASQYSTFMYQQTRFIHDLFKDPKANAKPIARFLVGAQILGEMIGDIRASLKGDDIWGDDEDEWIAILKNKRVPNPAMRALQNLSLVGGAGAVQVLMERFASSDFPGNLLGPVPNTVLEGLKKTKKSVDTQDIEPLEEFGTRQIPVVGNKLANEAYR